MTVVHDPDLVNFTPSHNEQTQEAGFMQKSLDDFVSLPPPNHNSKIGAATHSIDRTSQHLRLTQNLARELEQKLSLQLKGHREREKERDAQRDKAIAQVK